MFNFNYITPTIGGFFGNISDSVNIMPRFMDQMDMCNYMYALPILLTYTNSLALVWVSLFKLMLSIQSAQHAKLSKSTE